MNPLHRLRPTSLLCQLVGCLALAGCSASGSSGGAGESSGSASAQSGSAQGGQLTTGGSAPMNGAAVGSSLGGGGGSGVAPGGAATSGGTAGSGSGGSAGAAAGSPCGLNPIFCSDFEAAALAPELLFYPEYLRTAQTFITLDKTLGHASAGSLKVTGSDYSQMLGVAVPSKFWGRVYLRSDTDIQQGHNTYVTAGTGTGDPNDGTYIRIGEHQCQLELNRNTDDKELLSNGGTYSCTGGVRLVANSWYCLEFYYDGPGQETRVFVDGNEVTSLHTTDWGSYDYKIFKLGFEKYHGAAKTLWYDDLALAGSQLGCL